MSGQDRCTIFFLGQWDLGQNWDRSVPRVFHSGIVGMNAKLLVCRGYSLFHRRSQFFISKCVGQRDKRG
jgi:hypothetical protein